MTGEGFVTGQNVQCIHDEICVGYCCAKELIPIPLDDSLLILTFLLQFGELNGCKQATVQEEIPVPYGAKLIAVQETDFFSMIQSLTAQLKGGAEVCYCTVVLSID